MRQHETVVQGRAPADELAVDGIDPETGDQRAHQQLLGKRHARVGRHLETAELDEAEPSCRAVGREQLVDADLGAVGVAGDVGQKIAEQAVDEPGQRLLATAGGSDLRHGDLQLVEAVVTSLVDTRRLAGRADEHAGEEVGERG